MTSLPFFLCALEQLLFPVKWHNIEYTSTVETALLVEKDEGEISHVLCKYICPRRTYSMEAIKLDCIYTPKGSSPALSNSLITILVERKKQNPSNILATPMLSC